ncbi:MAG: hypothetical protein H0W03_09630 [Solirubrobacterales bacterium]|nr:hypothetical protein [Solirubrobacterales bacterium]
MEAAAQDQWRQAVRRMRWRLRGAWMWPVFAVLTLVDAVLLHALPLAGQATGLVAGLLLGAFFNLLVIAVVAPLVAILVRRRRPDLPRVVAVDYVGAVLMLGVTATFLAIGLSHRSTILASQDAMALQADVASRYVAAQGPPDHQARVHEMTTLQIEDQLYRTCVPGGDPDRWLCLFVDTSTSPAGVTLDANRESNASFNRPGGFELVYPTTSGA